ncbi:polysaccharide deacetylase family protein [Marinobacter sp. bablab_jr008]|uniref:polysaccharide deacetylase family protein n=1 Tax=Marinobacter sp. bablab_jr008 TaxID=2755064 RepID=UPI0018F1F41E|nr:polysaccharide deacetylase family protein [Marinobacter sp. bablab_jr008]
MTPNDLIYRIVRPFGGLKVAKYLSRKHPRILMYHRIVPNVTPGAIDINRFRQQMRTIKRELNPVSLTDLIVGHEKNNIPENAIVITFDDGYADFYDYAYPVLIEEKIPCTLFVTTGFVNGDNWLWPDRLRYCVDNTPQESIRLPGKSQSLSLRGCRTSVWNAIADYCLTLPNKEKIEFLDRVETELRVAPPKAPPPQFKALDWSQIREIAGAGFEIGSHSVSHPVMTSLDDESLRFELLQSKLEIERQIGRQVTSFCYPNGQPIDFDERVKTEVRRAGYRCGLAAFPGRATLGDLMAVHRYPGGLSNSLFEKTVFGLSFLGLPHSFG